MKHQKILLCVFSLTVSIASFAAGYFLRGITPFKRNWPDYVQTREGGYKHINPLLACDIAEDVLDNKKLSNFENKVDDYLKLKSDKSGTPRVSVYFREMNEGLWFAIGKEMKFTPASLRKIPLMIALLKMSERQTAGNLLAREVKFDLSSDYNANQNVMPSQTMTPGNKYQIKDLISRMIVYSDNNAFTLLTKVVDPAEFDNVYSELDIPISGLGNRRRT